MFTSTPLADLSYTIPSFVILEVTCDWPNLYNKSHGLSTTQQNLASTRMWRSLHAVSMNPMHNKGGRLALRLRVRQKYFQMMHKHAHSLAYYGEEGTLDTLYMQGCDIIGRNA